MPYCFNVDFLFLREASQQEVVKQLKHLFQGRFEPLQIYFEGITQNDLAALTEEEIVGDCNANHKMLMRTFLRQEMAAYIDQDDPFVANNFKFLLQQEKKKPEVENGWLNLKNRLISSAFQDLKIDLPPINKWNPDSVKDIIKNIDLSFNNLLDVDVSFIRQLVNVFAKRNALEIVDISWNRLYGKGENSIPIDEPLKDILKKCEFLDVTGNPLASIDRQEFYKTLTNAEFSHLIFVPENWLAAGGWKPIVPEKYHDNVTEAHRKYFLRRKS